ncbi:MAG: hypothetical protein ACE5H2_06860 [Terriglobia bacterium]
MKLQQKQRAKRILSVIGDGTLGLSVLPILAYLLVLLRQALASFGGERDWMYFLDNHGIPIFVPVFLLFAPLGFPLVGYLSYRFPQFRWRRDWWFVLLSEVGMAAAGLALVLLVLMVASSAQILGPHPDVRFLESLSFAIAYIGASLYLPVPWFVYRRLRVPSAPKPAH